MNEDRFRLVFNTLRAMTVAVGETASTARKSARGGPRPAVRSRVPRAVIAVMVLPGTLVPIAVSAQISPRAGTSTHVVPTLNGLPQVNIAAPSGAGVSVNVYDQFDVQRAGVILNNSPTIVQTQQAGMINGNPNFGPGQSARIIVNQVESIDPSQFRGFVEVGGNKAEVILANPAGIAVDGGGFINTSRATLTTGLPYYGADGSLAGYNVSRGLISVHGAGLNVSNVDQVDLISRAVQANAAIHAKTLNVVAGANQVDRDTLAANATAGDGPAPGVSIDVGQLGGMYANRILLVGTEDGVGVNHAGVVTANAGELTLRSNGQLELSGDTSATGHLSLTARDGIENSGTTEGRQGVAVDTRGVLVNSGLLQARQNLDIHAGSVNSTGTLSAGVTGDGSVGHGGDLNVMASGVVNATGENVAGGNAALTAARVDVSGSRTRALGKLELTANGGDVRLTGARAGARGTLTANASGAVIADRGMLFSEADMRVSAGTLSNRGGNLSARGPLSIETSEQVANRGGTIVTDGALKLTAGDIANDRGTIRSRGTLSIFGASLDNTAGRISSFDRDGLSVTTSGPLTNDGGVLEGLKAMLSGATVDNSSGSIQADSVSLSGTDLVNRGGTITQNGTGTMTVEFSGTLNNDNGSLLSKTDLAVTSGSLANDGGSIGSNSSGTIQSGTLTNRDGSIVASSLSATISATLDNSGGTLEADYLALKAANLTNHGGTITHYGASPMLVDVSGNLDNSNDGLIQTNSTHLVLAPAALNNSGGAIVHGGNGSLELAPGNGASALNNASGKIVTLGQTDILAGSLDNSSGMLDAWQGVMANIAGDLNNAHGLLRTDASMSLANGGALMNRGGRIQAGRPNSGDVSAFDVQAASIDNADGAMNSLGTGKMTVQGGSHIVNNQAGGESGMGIMTGNGDVEISASSITNTLGGQLSGANLHVTGTTLDNSGGAIGSVAHATGDVHVEMSGAVTNTNGLISSTRDLSVTASTLLQGGNYSAAHDATLRLQGDFAAMPDTEFNVGHDLAIALPGTFDNQTNLQASHNLSVDASNIVNAGAMSAGGVLRTHSTNLTNTGSIVGAGVTLAAQGTLSNVGPSALIGGSDSDGLVEILAHKIENRDDTSTTDTMAQTSIFGLGRVVIAGGKDGDGNYTNAAQINNASALIQSDGDMTLHADKVTNARQSMKTSGYASSIDPVALERLGISMSGRIGEPGVMDPASIGGVFIDPPHGGQWNSTYQYTTYTGTAAANTVTEISPAAQIVSGGKLDAKSVGTLQNYWSNVAAVGNVDMPARYDADGWKATSQQAPGVVVTYSGQYHYDNYDNSEHDWKLPFGDAPFVGAHPGGYTQKAPADIRPYALPAYDSTLASNATMSGTGVSLNNTAANAPVPSLGLLPGQSVPGLTLAPLNGRASGTAPVASTVRGSSTVPLDPVVDNATARSVLDNLTIPQGGLFKPSPVPTARYVIETNPAFTSRKNFLSSDYFFQQIGVDLAYIPKRLGDGFYEQQLVRNQITALTGRTALGPYTDLQSMYESLLAAGAARSKAFELPLGASLSADQVSRLTDNVVMMETRVVGGVPVLVPVVYLAKVNQQNMSNGPLITATDIAIQNAQSFVNSGTVRAGNTLSIQAKQIDNTFGALQSGGLSVLTATGTVDLTSANVKAGSLFLNAGGDLILDTATNTHAQTNQSGATRVTTTLGPRARIDVAGDAAVIADGNFRQRAGELSVGGNFGALIGGDWTLSSQNVGERKVVQRATGVSDTDFNRSVGSAVKVGGVSGIGIGGSLTARGANIDLRGGGTIAAIGNVSLLSASATSTVTSNSSGSDRHGNYSEAIHSSDETLTGSTLSGGDSVNIFSAKDIALSGSALVLDKGKAVLAAAGDVSVGAALTTHELHAHETHSHGAVVSSTKVASGIDRADTIAHGSLVSADSVSIKGGRDINLTGSAVVATRDVSLDAARHVNILAAQDRSDSSAYYNYKQSGLMSSGGFGFTVGSAEHNAQSTGHIAQQSQQRSTVGAVQGNVSISARENVQMGGSDVVAGKAADPEENNAKTAGNIRIVGRNVMIDPSRDDVRMHDRQASKSNGITVAVTGTPLDAVRNLRDNASSGNTFQRTQGVATEMGASMADVPSISVTLGRSENNSTIDASSLMHAGSTIRGAGNVSVMATGGAQQDAQRRVTDGDITVIGSSISAGGETLLEANRDVTLAATTDLYRHGAQASSSNASIGLMSPSLANFTRWIGGTANNDGVGPSPYNASRMNSDGNSTETRQSASVVSGDSVMVRSRAGDVDVTGSGVSGTQDVWINAEQGAINVLAGLETRTDHEESSSRRIGSLGSNGTSTGFSVGVAKRHAVQDQASQTQSRMRSQIASASGNVALYAEEDVTVVGSDLIAGNDLKLVGKNVRLDPGTDTTQDSQSQHSSQFGVSLALTGAAGNAVAAVNQAANHPARGDDARLGALDKAQAALTAYNTTKVAQAFAADNATAQPLVKATVSVGGGTSSSESSSRSLSNTGSSLTAGGNVKLIATGSGATDRDGLAVDGDIDTRGTYISGKNVSLDAARDLNLQSAKDTTLLSSRNSSSGGSIGIGAGFGGQQNGFTLELGASWARGHANGQSVTNRDTQISASGTLSLASGRDANLRGAQVAGHRVETQIGHDLNIQSQQDTATYDSRQTSSGFQASVCVPPFCYGQTVSGSGNTAQQNVTATYASVNRPSGIYAGDGGYRVNVGNHTQLDGGALSSSASEDMNSLSTQSFAYTDIDNKASYSGKALGFGASGGFGTSLPTGVYLNTPVVRTGPTGPGPVSANGMGPSGFSAAGTGSDVSGTTYASVSPGEIIVRDDADTGHDSTAGLHRDPQTANGAVTNIFDARKVQNDLAVQQTAGQVGMQVVGTVADGLRERAVEAKLDAEREYRIAAAADDEAGMAKARTAMAAADSRIAFWGEDGAGRIGVHTAVSGVAAALGGGNVAGAVAGTIAGDLAGAAAETLTGDTLGGALLTNVASGVAGAGVGGVLGGAPGALSGSGGALNADLYNRQLHPDERQWAKENAESFAKHYQEKTGKVLTVEQALEMLLGTGYRLVDVVASKGLGGDAVAVAYINDNGGDLFRATAAEYKDPFLYGNEDRSLTPEQRALPGAVANPALGSGIGVSVTGGLAIAAAAPQVGAFMAAGGKYAAYLFAGYKAAQAGYSLTTGALTGAGVSAGLYTFTAASSAALAKFQGDDAATAFDQRFSLLGLGTAATVGAANGMFGTSMFKWADIPNKITNVSTVTGAVIRINGVAQGQVANRAAQAAVNQHEEKK